MCIFNVRYKKDRLKRNDFYNRVSDDCVRIDSYRYGKTFSIRDVITGNIVSVLEIFEHKDFNKIVNVHTALNHRNKGLASLNLLGVIQYARKKCPEKVLKISTDNPQALRLYEKLGFKLDYKRKSDDFSEFYELSMKF